MKSLVPIPIEDEALPRLLIVGAFPPSHRVVVGGIATSCRVLLESSLPHRAHLTLVDSTQISNPPPVFFIRLLLAIPRFIRYLVQFESTRPNAVLLFTSTGASVVEKGAMAWYARLRGTQTLMLPRGQPPDDRQPAWLRHLLNKVGFGGAQKILCQGLAWQRFAIDILRMNAQDVPVVQNWTATPALLAIGRDRIPRLSVTPVRLLFLGWLEREKGIFELIEACQGLSDTVPFVLDIVGDGHAMSQARVMVERSALNDKVNFYGWLQGAEKEAALARADVLVLPSWSEGLPNAMIEAMAARMAIVVTSVGNIPDTVVDGREVLLVPPKDVAALRAALTRVVGDSELRWALGNSGYASAERRFGVERAIDSILIAIGHDPSLGINNSEGFPPR